MDKKDLGFNVHEIPELSLEQKIAHGFVPGTKDRKKDYGNRWQKNKKTIAVIDTLFGKLEAIRKQRGFSTKGELIEYLVELDTMVNPELETISMCKKCSKELDVPQNANLARLVHMDLEKDCHCNGSIVKKQKIVKNAKDKETDTTGYEKPQFDEHGTPINMF